MTGNVQVYQQSSLLQLSIRANGVFCMLAGVGATAGATPLANLLGVSEPPAVAVAGVVILAYGALVFWLAGQHTYLRRIAITATALDVLWVLGSLALLASGWLPL